MNIQNISNGQDLLSVRNAINDNFDLIQTAIEQVCNPSLSQVENPIRTCLENDFSDPCNGQNISFDLLKSISDQLNTALSVSCPSGSSLPTCQAANGLATGVQSLVSNIATQIGSALSNNCPNGQTPSCSIYSPIGSGTSSLIQNIVNEISSSFSNPCSLSSPSCNIYSPLYTAKIDFAEGMIDTVFSSLNSILNQNPCSLFNSQNLTLSGPFSSCINLGSFTSQIGLGIKTIIDQGLQTAISTISSVLSQNPCTLFNNPNITITGPLASCLTPSINSPLGQGVKEIINQVLSTITQTVGNVLSASPSQLLNGNVFNLAGPLASCFGGLSISLGGSIKNVVEDAVQTAIDTIMSAIEDPCATPQVSGPLSSLINITLPSVSNLIDQILESSCVKQKIFDFIATNQGDILQYALGGPVAQTGVDAILGFVDTYKCELFEKFIDTSGNAGNACIKDSILSFVENNQCEFFEKFIATDGTTSQACVKDSILEFVKTESCSLIGKINEGNDAHDCQPQFNTLVDSILCEYLEWWMEQGLAGTNGVSPKGCTLQTVNQVIDDYCPLFFVTVNGQPKQVKFAVQMKVDILAGEVTTQYYDEDGNKI